MPKHLIDKSTLVAEIEKRFDEYSSSILKHYDPCTEARVSELGKVLVLLNTLEVKEEVLDKEGKTKLMQKCVHKAYKRGYDMGVLQTTNKMNHNMKEVDLDNELDFVKNAYYYFTSDERSSMNKVAKHFFELGLKAQKGE